MQAGIVNILTQQIWYFEFENTSALGNLCSKPDHNVMANYCWKEFICVLVLSRIGLVIMVNLKPFQLSPNYSAAAYTDTQITPFWLSPGF